MSRDRQAGLCECARPVRGRRPAASGFWETHSARVLIKNTQATLSTDAWGFWTFLTHSHSYTHVYIHVPSTGSNSHYFLFFTYLLTIILTLFSFFNFLFIGLASVAALFGTLNCGSSKNSLCQFWSQSFKHSSATRQQLKVVSFVKVLADNFWNKILFSFLDALEVPWIWLFQFPPDFLENSQMEYSNFVKLRQTPFLSF